MNPCVLTASCRAGSSSTPASPRLEIFNCELKPASSSQDQTLQTSKTVLMGPICLWLKGAQREQQMQNGARGAGGTAGVHARIFRGHPISPEHEQKPVVTLQRSINKCLGKSMKVSKAPAQREAQGGQWEVEMLWSSGWQQDTKGEMCRGRQGSRHLVGPHKAVRLEGCSPNLQRHSHFCKKLYVFPPASFWEKISSLGRAWISYSVIFSACLILTI